MKTLKLVPEKTNLQFISKRKIAYVLSGLAAIASLVLFSLWDLNYGIDFQGGVVVEVRVAEEPDMEALRAAMGTLGLGDVTITELGETAGVEHEGHDVSIRAEVQGDDTDSQEGVKTAIREKLVELYGTEIAIPDSPPARI